MNSQAQPQQNHTVLNIIVLNAIKSFELIHHSRFIERNFIQGKITSRTACNIYAQCIYFFLLLFYIRNILVYYTRYEGALSLRSKELPKKKFPPLLYVSPSPESLFIYKSNGFCLCSFSFSVTFVFNRVTKRQSYTL